MERIATFFLFMGLIAAGCGPGIARSAMMVGPQSVTPLRRFVVIAMTTDPVAREQFENAIAEQLAARAGAVSATPSYRLVRDILSHPRDGYAPLDDYALPATTDFDAVILCRPTDARTEDIYVPGGAQRLPEYYATIWKYYGHWKPIVFSDDYADPVGLTRVATQVYEMPSGTLLFASLSAPVRMRSPGALMLGVGLAVSKDLQRRGLIPAK